MGRCLGMEDAMVTKKLKKMAALACVICLVCANALIVYADEQSKKDEETQKAQNDVILPPTQQEYTAYLFDISLPTCVGSGEYKLSKHYYDPVLQYGYPASMKFSMSTSGTCDFGAHVWAEDNFGDFHDISGGSYQSNGMVAEKKFLYGVITLSAVNTATHPSTAWVCDDEDYGELYNLHMEQK